MGPIYGGLACRGTIAIEEGLVDDVDEEAEMELEAETPLVCDEPLFVEDEKADAGTRAEAEADADAEEEGVLEEEDAFGLEAWVVPASGGDVPKRDILETAVYAEFVADESADAVAPHPLAFDVVGMAFAVDDDVVEVAVVMEDMPVNADVAKMDLEGGWAGEALAEGCREEDSLLLQWW